MWLYSYGDSNQEGTCTECNQSNCSSRYMTISDEWEIPEKQPFKDLVRLCFVFFKVINNNIH